MPECIDSSVGVWASSAGRNMLDWSIAGTERTPRKLEASPNLSPGVCNYIVFSINFNSTSAITLSSVLTSIRVFHSKVASGAFAALSIKAWFLSYVKKISFERFVEN